MDCIYKQQKVDAESRYLPPLCIGKSFFCYRDVNKAIDKHREIYGLRLALKRAVKLENYRLKIENMKDLNLRLKYGELDYHCFVATGRPGRPGNDERCHQLVRLRLSPDSRSLIVYESHDHNITPHLEAQNYESLNPTKLIAEIGGSLSKHTFCLEGDVTITPISPESIQNVLAIMPRSGQVKTDSLSGIDSPSIINDNCLVNNVNLMSTLETVSAASPINLQPKTVLERNSTTLTPTSLTPTSLTTSTYHNVADAFADNPEKITLTIKKSECVPNEMVVVGSLRHVEEQKKSVSPSEMLLGKPFQQLQNTVPTVVSIVPKANSSISTSPRMTSSVSTSSNSNQLAVLGKNNPVAISINNRTLVNIAPKPSAINCAKSSVINNSKPLTAIKPKIICEQETVPNVKHSASTSVPNVTDNVVHESTLKPTRQILPIKNVVNRPASIATNKHNENSVEIIFEKEISIVKQLQKIESPVGPPKSSGNVKLQAPKQPIKAKQVTVLKQSPNMKQVIINKPSPKGTLVAKPVVAKPLGPINDKWPGIRQGSPILIPSVVKVGVTKASQNVRSVLPSSKSIGAYSPPVTTTISTIDAQPNKPTVKVSLTGKCVEKAILKPKSITKNKDHPKVILQRHPTSSSPNECQKQIVPNQLPTSKILNCPKKLKKKLACPCPPDSFHYNGRSSSNKIDTELGYNEKQHIAHGVLLTLLKVTCHLPMVEFSDALETFEILTDAFRLNHKVSLSIKHDEEDDMCSSNKYDHYNEEVKSEEKDFIVSSTTDDEKLAVTQIDGQFDNMEFLKEITSFQDVSPISLKVMPTLEDDMQMEVEEVSHLQIANRPLALERASNYDACKQSATRTLKRTSSEFDVFSSCSKHLKR